MTDLLDADNAPSGEPSTLIVGDLALWRRSDLSDYPNSTHTLKYSFRKLGVTASEIEITAVADGTSDYLVSVPASTTSGWTAGKYAWQAYIIRDADSERITVDYGTVTILSNLDADTDDARTHARRMVDLIESVIENRADSDVQFYMIAGRQVSKMPVADLITWRDYYLGEVAAQENAEDARRGKASKSKLKVRFV